MFESMADYAKTKCSEQITTIWGATRGRVAPYTKKESTMRVVADITRAVRGTEAPLVSRAQKFAQKWTDGTVSILCYPDQQDSIPATGQGLPVILVSGARNLSSVFATINSAIA